MEFSKTYVSLIAFPYGNRFGILTKFAFEMQDKPDESYSRFMCLTACFHTIKNAIEMA